MSDSQKKKSRKHRNVDTSDSESSENSGMEWVEAEPAKQTERRDIADEPTTTPKIERDDWMLSSDLLGRTYSRKDLQAEKKKKEDREGRLNLDNHGQHARELNPYWRDGGDGLPREREGCRAEPDATRTVGDNGLGWLQKAYRRAVEQAKEEGRTLEEVAAERWGSLENLEKLIDAARGSSKRASPPPSYHRRHRGEDGRRRERRSSRERDRDGYARHRSHKSYDKGRGTFARPDGDDDVSGPGSSSSTVGAHKRERKNVPRWKKPASGSDDDDERGGSRDVRDTRDAKWETKTMSKWKKSEIADEMPREKYVEPKEPVEEHVPQPREVETLPVMSDEDMNKLAAKILKAELMGDEDEVQSLKHRLEEARQVRSFGSKQKEQPKERTEIVTCTDQRGVTRPFVSQAMSDPYGGRSRKAKKRPIETHDTAGMRVRYFADDEKYSLQQMFEQEKLTTAEDQNALFAKAAGAKPNPDFDIDEVLINKESTRDTDAKIRNMEARAVQGYSKRSAAIDKCSFCFDGGHLQRHLIIAMSTKVYLRLPHHHSLTEGHCQIIPMHHVVASTHLDEDVWEEVENFKKALSSMFGAMDKDVVFFETSMNRKYYPHMVLECVPLPRDVSYMAPMYFKKAVLESESEWAHNKKLVELKGRDIRRAVPKELPYFCVNFGIRDGGFAHVIENEREFPKTFAQETIAGVLDLDYQDWRRPARENFDQQSSKVLKFTEYWKPYDWTKKSS